MEFIAHRGESADAPENTMAAFRLAWERGVKAVELDVRLTRDGELIVCHDATTLRTTGVELRIEEHPAAELQALDAGSWRGAEWAGERLPLLRDVLPEMPGGSRCFIELKVGPEAVPALAEALRAARTDPPQVVVISFLPEAVAEVRRSLPILRTLLLSGFRRDAAGACTPSIDELVRQARGLRAHGLDLAADGPIDAAFVEAAHAAGLDLYVWTVDDRDAARELIAAGVDGITSNRAAWLRAQCAPEAAR